MSSIVLSSSVRQNLLSLQSTADLLAQTQNRLSTGKSVNSALDNPTNFFTAQSLDNRASDINNLLDSIGNGVQVLQSANTGLTSLQKLVDTAKSIATQALQSPVGYSTKSSFSTTITGATATNLLGTGAATDATTVGSVETNNQTQTFTASTGIGTAVTANHQAAFTNTPAALGSQLFSGVATNASGATLLSALTDNANNPQGIAANDTLTVNGKTITFQAGAGALAGSGTAYTLGIGTSLTTLAAAIDTLQGNTGAGSVASSAAGGKLQLNTGLAADLSISGSGSVLANLGINGAGQHSATRGGGATSTPVITSSTALSGSAIAGGADALASGLTASDFLIVNGKTISFNSGAGTSGTAGANNLTIDVTTGTVNDILTDLAAATGGTATVDVNGKINLTTTTGADISLGGSNAATLGKLGLTTIAINGAPGAVTTSINRTAIPTPQISGTTALSGVSSGVSNALTTGFSAGDSLTVNGQTLTFVASGAADGNHINVTDNVTTLLSKIDNLTGNTAGASGAGFVAASSVTGGAVTFHTGTTGDLSIASSNSAALAALGFGSSISTTRGTGASPLTGLVLNIGATVVGGTASSITFGTGANQVSSLNDLNSALSANNLQATLAANGTLTITTSNDFASASIGALTGSATGVGKAFNTSNVTNTSAVADAAAQATRDNLVTQYNNVLNQITTTAQDASFNGVNLLGGDTLKLTFNETGKSSLSVSGVNFNSAGLGLAGLATGSFKDNQSVNSVVGSLTTASTTLRTEASTLGSNLSIVQIRQDFNKNLINVLQTGSSNLTLADTNEEAANSQALSTRQSIAVSALSLANQSQQSVLQLLR